eukprot:2661013-Rhodomonas_salina.1
MVTFGMAHDGIDRGDRFDRKIVNYCYGRLPGLLILLHMGFPPKHYYWALGCYATKMFLPLNLSLLKGQFSDTVTR